MLFTSLQFIVFFALVLALNQTLRRWPLLQKLMLLFASYYFYVFGTTCPRYFQVTARPSITGSKCGWASPAPMSRSSM